MNCRRRFFSTIRIYTDGSCLHAGLCGGLHSGIHSGLRGGIGIYFPNGEHPNISMAYPQSFELPPTSQRCELLAVSYAIVIHHVWLNSKPCTIYTDSENTIDSLTHYCNLWSKNGWKKTNGDPVKNTDLLIPLHTLFTKSPNVEVQFVKAHTGLLDEHSLNNNIADAFAKKGLYR
jgi:ribonuclease HI